MYFLSHIYVRKSVILRELIDWSTNCYVLAFFINLSAVAAMLPNMERLSAILKPKCANNFDFLLSLPTEFMGVTILS